MAHLALYRKYRPNNFNDLIGQDHIVKTLVNQIESDRLGHAYLFTGTRGTGKTSAAKIFAKAINCLSPINGSPCGKCESCKALLDPSNIDVVEIDAASNNGVNEIRELREKVQYPPVSCKYKVYIVDEVHMLTGAAFNALLKTLEEPPKHAVFILATTEVHKIPATILSRCMRFDFRLIPTEKIADLIGKIYDEIGKEYEKEAIFALAKAGDGSIRDALSVADTALSFGTGKLTYNDVMDVIGSTNVDLITIFVKNLLIGNTGDVLETINQLSSLGKSIGVLIKDVSMLIRDLLIIKTCSNAKTILSLPDTRYNALNDLSKSTTEERLIRILEIFSQAENSLKYSNHARVVFETAAVKASRPDSDYNIDALLSRIKELENKIQSGVSVAVNTVLPSQEQTIVEDKPIVQESKPNEVEKTFSISDFDSGELKGKLLIGLRQIGCEMLWNVMQNVNLSVSQGVMVITADNVGDVELLDKQASKERIYEALSDFDSFDIKVVQSEREKYLNEVDEAADRIKKIFGDDIVIVK